ncbi:MAG: hypothetical protein LPK46_02140 [Bacteroidota bacterium]|nr:hypothetical protein [Bacteroidota bacterium]MDX5504917.1 hypothetical protein [Bacteroidota bacterium]
MEEDDLNGGYDPRQLQLIHLTLLVGQLVFFILSFYILKDDPNARHGFDFRSLWFYIIPAAAGLLNYWGGLMFWRRLAQLDSWEDLQDKLRALTNAHLVRWAIVEVSTLLLLTFAIFQSSWFFLLLGMANIVYFFFLRPRLFTFDSGLEG